MMSKLEKEFYKRFNNQRLSGDDFDADGLWDEISNELEVGSQGPSSTFWRAKWASILSIVLLIGGMIGFMLSQKSETTTQSKIKKTAQVESIENLNQTTSIQKEESIITSKKEKEGLDFELINSNKKSVIHSGLTSKINETQRSVSIKQTESDNIFRNGSFDKKESTYSELKNHESSQLATTQKIEASKANSEVNTSIASEEKDILRNSNLNIEEKYSEENLDFLPFVFDVVKSQNETTPVFDLINLEVKKSPKEAPISFDINIFGGANHTTFYLTSIPALIPPDTRISSSEQEVVGTSVGVNFGVLVKKRWHFNSGVEYHQLQSKFNYDLEKDTQVISENQLIKVWIDETSGDTIQRQTDNVLIDATATRKIEHYNSFQRISIPLEFGFRRKFKKFIYGISAGPVLNFTLSESGRTSIPDNQILDFNNETGIYFRRLDVGFRVKPILGFQLNKKFNITLQPQWMWSENPNFYDTDIKVNIQQINLNMGIGYSF